MIERRQFIQSCLSALAGLSLLSPSRALTLAHQALLGLGSPNEELPTTIEKVLATSKQIKVIGVGGGGGNAVHHMIACGLTGMEYIVANTDTDALNSCGAHKTIQLHRKTLSASTRLGRCRETAELAASDIRAAISGADMLFITVGLGGGTGTA